MRFLVVDDDPQVLEALVVGLQANWPDADVLSATDGADALRVFNEREPDMVLLDVLLPALDGFEVLREIRKVSDAPVIILTAKGEEVDEARGLHLGADDYVTKPFSHAALVARIRAVLRRANLQPPGSPVPDFTAGDLAIYFGQHRVTVRGHPVKLTPIEYRLLYHLVQNAGHVLPHELLLERVWGHNHTATAKHVKVLVSRLRLKLERSGGHRFIENEFGLGYRFRRPARETVDLTADRGPTPIRVSVA